MVENYLHESEDDILDFTEATTNKKILSEIQFEFCIYFNRVKKNFLCLVSKPKSEHHTNPQKISNTDDSIKTAPDGRLIIVDEPSAPLHSKSGEYLIIYVSTIVCQVIFLSPKCDFVHKTKINGVYFICESINIYILVDLIFTVYLHINITFCTLYTY